jgi:hypothetical protein
MTRESTLVLDSIRLAQYAVQVPCYICNNGNTFDAELCRHCFAPMALAHQVNTQNIAPRMLAAIGPSAVGKTVYLGMLMDVLSRQPDQMQLLARGAFSINLQQAAMEALSVCEFPNKTPNEPDRWNWVHCQLRLPKQKRPVELIMPDMAGEALLEEVAHPHTYPVIRSLLQKCAGAMVLVDASKLYEGDRDQDYFTMKLLSYLMELDSDTKTGWQNRLLAVVFTKADQCENCFDDPLAFAQRHAGGLWQHCQERFKHHRFFATGVAGACAYSHIPGTGRVRVPLRVEPRGIVEPFRWLIQQMKQ